MTELAASERKLALAVDVGGTRIKVGLISRDGRLLSVQRIGTPSLAEPEFVVSKMLLLAHELCAAQQIDRSSVHGIGVSMAGFVTAEGMVTATAHLSREWIGYDLKTRLLQDWQVPCYFALDTPAPTLGEAYFGAGRGINDFVYVTVSTGIGAGIVANGKYFTGGLGWAGGVGHSIVDENSGRVCEGCGNAGCLETFAAKQGILTTARELLRSFPDSEILNLARGNQEAITPQIVFEAARAGDPLAQTVFQRAGHALGVGLTNLIDIVAPQQVVIGGGIAQAGDLLLDPARAVVRERAFPPQLRRTEIVQAALGDLSGVYGAAAMVFYDVRVNPGASL